MNYFLEAVLNLESYIYKKRFEGYEPYDGLLSQYKILHSNKFLRLFCTHFNKVTPLNFRYILGIKPYVHSKTMALMGIVYAKMYKIFDDEIYRRKYERCIEWLLTNQRNGGGWKGSYDYQMAHRLVKRNELSTFGTTLACLSFLNGYEVFGNIELLDVVHDINRKVLISRCFFPSPTNVFKYATNEKRPIINSNSTAGGMLSYLYYLTGDQESLKIGRTAIDFVVNSQFENGAWPYVKGQKINKTQIDFHQGFILDGLFDFIRYVKPTEKKYMKSIILGSEFYKKQQFLPDGRCRWRWQRLWPIDIHNQAQGILTFSKLGEIHQEYLAFAEAITKWTIENMQDETGYFYYQKWPFFTNKIPYMAWAQAWMMLALVTYLEFHEQ